VVVGRARPNGGLGHAGLRARIELMGCAAKGADPVSL